jgi:hypothetical protein
VPGLKYSDPLCRLTAAVSRQEHARMAFRLSALLLLPFASIAAAQELSLPSDAELHSAYCVPVLKWTIENTRSVITYSDNGPQSPEVRRNTEEMRKALGETQTALNRLQAYLAPRIAYRDPIAFVAAQKRADADIAQAKSLADRCITQCTASSPRDPIACLKSCESDQGKELTSRLSACRTPSWLPF